RLDFLDADERRLLSQIQGRTYANMFGLVERFIGVKMLQVSQAHWFGDQVALEALVRFTDEELKHQALFRRIEQLAAAGMEPGYVFAHTPDQVASQVLQASTWAVLALTCHIELFTQVHYRQSIEPDDQLSDLYRDVFLFHWREESQHAILDELEWAREDARLTPAERDKAVDDLIALVGAVDGIVRQQAQADARYFQSVCGRAMRPSGVERVEQGLLDAYRWQYIVSGVQDDRFNHALQAMTTGEQRRRIATALAPLMATGQPHRSTTQDKETS
ncbi:MAG: hypothetical protein KA164_06210, partial [Rhodoferax sp.]|nr:hypothetical protein [Rhodoferax sp.]